MKIQKNLTKELESMKCPEATKCLLAYAALELSKESSIKNKNLLFPELDDYSINIPEQMINEECNKNYKNCVMYLMSGIEIYDNSTQENNYHRRKR